MNKYIFFILLCTTQIFAQSMIIDHNYTDITKLPEQAIIEANNKLHIAYGHTSHGCQISYGMSGLVNFSNIGGKGLDLPHDIFIWNKEGTNGALDFRDGVMYLDCGYYPEWVNYTISYLNSHSEINVIMWSWCGQVEEKHRDGKLYSEYLTPMHNLEISYPDVKFVYMTGHTEHSDDVANKAGNNVIRDYCITNNKILYDFADIESFNPDGTYFEYTDDDCAYYSPTGTYLGNWGLEWQNSHIENIDWYDCPEYHDYYDGVDLGTIAHTQPINVNQKAYAAWWMFAKIAGFDESSLPVVMGVIKAIVYVDKVQINWSTHSEIDCYGFYINKNNTRISELIPGQGNSSTEIFYEYTDYTYHIDEVYQIEEVSTNGVSTFYDVELSFATSSYVPISPPSNFELYQNYPNPFNGTTIIILYSSISQSAELSIYNLTGKLISSLTISIDGYTTVKIDATSMASGIYLYMVKTNTNVLTKKMCVLH